MLATRALRQAAAAAAAKPRAVLLGSGWGAFAVAKELRDRFEVTFVSPRNHMLFTPLLPSAASGVLNMRSIAEPIKHSYPRASYEAGEATAVDPVNKTVTVTMQPLGPKVAREERGAMTATLPYDVLVIAVGAKNQTFGIKGVQEHAYFMRSLTDARDVRKHLIRNVEAATFPGLSNRERRRLLSVVIAGGGPTGVELAAELHDLLQHDILKMYPQLRAEVSITIVEGRSLLGGFDASLRDFTMRKFARDRIRIQLGANVTAVQPHSLELSDGDVLEYGLLIWNTGLAPQPLVAGLDPGLWRKDAWGHLVVDDHMRVLKALPAPSGSEAAPSGASAAAAAAAKPGAAPRTTAVARSGAAAPPEVLPGVFCIGDAANVEGKNYAATAQVAEQQGLFLGGALRQAAEAAPAPTAPGDDPAQQRAQLVASILAAVPQQQPGFQYRHRGALAFIGGFTAAADFTKGSPIAPLYGKALSGVAAWLLYRSAYLSKLGSWRNRMQVPVDWLRALLFGRDTTTF